MANAKRVAPTFEDFARMVDERAARKGPAAQKRLAEMRLLVRLVTAERSRVIELESRLKEMTARVLANGNYAIKQNNRVCELEGCVRMLLDTFVESIPECCCERCGAARGAKAILYGAGTKTRKGRGGKRRPDVDVD